MAKRILPLIPPSLVLDHVQRSKEAIYRSIVASDRQQPNVQIAVGLVAHA